MVLSRFILAQSFDLNISCTSSLYLLCCIHCF